jgi:hypothetical protein
MYKIQIENEFGSLTERSFVDFKKCFEYFNIELKIRNIRKFEGFGVPKDEDIEEIGFGLMFYASNEKYQISLLKTATGKEIRSKNPFLRSYNGRMEKMIHFIITEGGREFMTLEIDSNQKESIAGGVVRFFEKNNQVIGILENKNEFEIVFSKSFETFGEAITAIEKHFAEDESLPEECKIEKTINSIITLTAIFSVGLPSIYFFSYLISLLWK